MADFSHRVHIGSDGPVPIGGVENPHELLGVAAHEGDPTTIIEAARRRLDALRASGGSEIEVKRVLIREILAARDAMLANIVSNA